MRYLIVLSFYSSFLVAADPPRFTDISYQGSGCPEGSVDIVRATDDASFSVNFNDFVVQPTAIESLLKNCALTAKIDVPLRYAVAIKSTSFAAEHIFDGNSFGRFDVDTKFAGRKASGSAQLRYTAVTSVNTGEMGWSKCGTDVDLVYEMKLTVRKSARQDTARGMVTNSQSINLLWRECH